MSYLQNFLSISNPIPPLKPQEAHVYPVNFARLNTRLADERLDFIKFLISILSTDEMERAKRFYDRHYQENFILIRGLLKITLSHYLSIEPEKIEFKYGDLGKPYLASISNIHFNLSHSHNFAVFAISCDREVGIDIEYINERESITRLVKRFFLLQEQVAIASLKLEAQTSAFYTLWTYKEAYAKAIGKGIFQCLAKTDVSSALTNSNSAIYISPYSITKLDIDANYAAALAIQGKDWHLKTLELI